MVKRFQIGEKLMVNEGDSVQQAGTYWKPNGRRDGLSCLGFSSLPASHCIQGKRLFQKNLGLKMYMSVLSVIFHNVVTCWILVCKEHIQNTEALLLLQ